MHSSRMRTGRSLTVCWSLLRGRGGSAPGGVSARGVSASGGVSAPRGCLLLGGCLLSGERCLLLGGVCSWGGCGWVGVVSQHALRQTPSPPPVNRMTNSSKNITLATTLLRPVIKEYTLIVQLYNL